jgi:acyl dehydratase
MAPPVLTLATYESLVGSELAVSSWEDVSQERIDGFADVTGDRQFIHVDPEAAKTSPFGGTIAHGFLTLSLLTTLTQGSLPRIDGFKSEVNYGFNSIRFIAPVRSGKRVRARFVLKAVAMRGTDAVQSTLGVTVEIEGEQRPALVAEWIILAYL